MENGGYRRTGLECPVDLPIPDEYNGFRSSGRPSNAEGRNPRQIAVPGGIQRSSAAAGAGGATGSSVRSWIEGGNAAAFRAFPAAKAPELAHVVWGEPERLGASSSDSSSSGSTNQQMMEGGPLMAAMGYGSAPPSSSRAGLEGAGYAASVGRGRAKPGESVAARSQPGKGSGGRPAGQQGVSEDVCFVSSSTSSERKEDEELDSFSPASPSRGPTSAARAQALLKAQLARASSQTPASSSSAPPRPAAAAAEQKQAAASSSSAAPDTLAAKPHMGGQWSIGAEGHATGNCKPCAWAWRPGGCVNSSNCWFCHLCEDGTIQRIRKERLRQVKARKRAEWLARTQAQANASVHNDDAAQEGIYDDASLEDDESSTTSAAGPVIV
eukprot:TRINITY_DN1565_c0_g3_i1.p1 TRINITY_DN1565_c0_g3~~TRINITY_DN1565_c0_g3_i1.p1  ORF type:complete len:383 (+),score=60.53 TRINITY_DN1565_c0_g3_i1:65-1213(+)